jgi:hypothetical protein
MTNEQRIEELEQKLRKLEEALAECANYTERGVGALYQDGSHDVKTFASRLLLKLRGA